MCAGGRFRIRKVPQGSGVCWCKFWRQVPESSGGVLVYVPEAGAGRFRNVPVCAGVGCGGRFRKVPEGLAGFRCVLV